MGKHSKKFTEMQIRMRLKIERDLSEIEPLCRQARKLTSAKGFADYYLQMRDLYDTQEAAYERLEEFHIAITGRRRYCEYDSFRVMLNRYLVGS